MADDRLTEPQDSSALVLGRALLEAIDSHQLDRVPDLYAENTRLEDPGGAVFDSGRALKPHLARLVTAFADIRHQVLHTIQSHDSAVIQGRIVATHT